MQESDAFAGQHDWCSERQKVQNSSKTLHNVKSMGRLTFGSALMPIIYTPTTTITTTTKMVIM